MSCCNKWLERVTNLVTRSSEWKLRMYWFLRNSDSINVSKNYLGGKLKNKNTYKQFH